MGGKGRVAIAPPPALLPPPPPPAADHRFNLGPRMLLAHGAGQKAMLRPFLFSPPLQGLLLAYHSTFHGGAPLGGAAQRWAHVPADISVPMSLPGWAWQPIARSHLVDGAVDMSVSGLASCSPDLVAALVWRLAVSTQRPRGCLAFALAGAVDQPVGRGQVAGRALVL